MNLHVNFWKKLSSCAIISILAGASAFTARAEEAPQATLDGGIPIASVPIPPGNYNAARPTYFENVKIKNWFNRTYLEGTLFYGQVPFNFSTEVKADPSGPNLYVATGTFAQNWSNGVTCNIPMSIEIQDEGGKLYFRSHTPASILLEAPVGAQCMYYNNYIWTFHTNPYELKTPIGN